MQAQDTTMDEDTLVTATEAGRELQQLRSKWRTIGTVLRLAAEVLDQIEKECSEENRLKQMLIQRQTRLGPLKWKDVIAALEDGTVGEERLALMLRMKIQFKVLITTPELEPPPPKVYYTHPVLALNSRPSLLGLVQVANACTNSFPIF